MKNKKILGIFALAAMTLLMTGMVAAVSYNDDGTPVNSDGEIYEDSINSDSNVHGNFLGSQNTIIVREGPVGDRYWADLADASAHPGIIAYRIQWFNGKWSKWYTPGKGDIDWKDNCGDQYYIGGQEWDPNRPQECERQVWTYFSDHNHEYITYSDRVDKKKNIPGIGFWKIKKPFWKYVAAGDYESWKSLIEAQLTEENFKKLQKRYENRMDHINNDGVHVNSNQVPDDGQDIDNPPQPSSHYQDILDEIKFLEEEIERAEQDGDYATVEGLKLKLEELYKMLSEDGETHASNTVNQGLSEIEALMLELEEAMESGDDERVKEIELKIQELKSQMNDLDQNPDVIVEYDVTDYSDGQSGDFDDKDLRNQVFSDEEFEAKLNDKISKKERISLWHKLKLSFISNK